MSELVGVLGFEPRTSWSQTRRASHLRYTPRISARFAFRSEGQTSSIGESVAEPIEAYAPRALPEAKNAEREKSTKAEYLITNISANLIFPSEASKSLSIKDKLTPYFFKRSLSLIISEKSPSLCSFYVKIFSCKNSIQNSSACLFSMNILLLLLRLYAMFSLIQRPAKSLHSS